MRKLGSTYQAVHGADIELVLIPSIWRCKAVEVNPSLIYSNGMATYSNSGDSRRLSPGPLKEGFKVGLYQRRNVVAVVVSERKSVFYELMY